MVKQKNIKDINEEVLAYIRIAELCHEVNRAYCICMGHKVLPVWKKLKKHYKKSALDGVFYHIENPKSKPEDSHNNWMKYKLKDGWKYGKPRNDKKKIHNLLVPYNKLPKEQQAKDYIFMTIVKQIIKEY